MPGCFHFASLVALVLVRQPTGTGKVIMKSPVPSEPVVIAIPGSSGGSSGSSAVGAGGSTGRLGPSAATGSATPEPTLLSWADTA